MQDRECRLLKTDEGVEKIAHIYIPLAISSTDRGGLGCLYGIILWEVLALYGVEHAIL